jgi:hypothetical protein
MRRARRATALLLLLAAGCARPRRQQPAPEPPVTALAVTAPTLSFCDQAGLHGLSLTSGREAGPPGPCPAGGLASAPPGPAVSVRNPDHGPDDVIEVEGVATSFPIAGRAHDWAAARAVVIVATATQVLRIDVAANRQTRLSSTGAERVATDGQWAAWLAGTTIVARRL